MGTQKREKSLIYLYKFIMARVQVNKFLWGRNLNTLHNDYEGLLSLPQKLPTMKGWVRFGLPCKMTSCLLGPGRSDYVLPLGLLALWPSLSPDFQGIVAVEHTPPPPHPHPRPSLRVNQQITVQPLRALILLMLAESLVGASMLLTNDTFQLLAVNILNKKSRIFDNG
jgi:hypothetical protein